MRDSDRDEHEISRVRQEIIDSARTNMAIKERERRIQAKKERQSEARRQAAPQSKTNARQRRSQVEQDDGNIRVTIYIPRFLIKIILANAVILFVVYPAAFILLAGYPEAVKYAVVYVPLIPLALLLMCALWYVYWWVMGVLLTCLSVFILMRVLMEVLIQGDIRRALENLLP